MHVVTGWLVAWSRSSPRSHAMFEDAKASNGILDEPILVFTAWRRASAPDVHVQNKRKDHIPISSKAKCPLEFLPVVDLKTGGVRSRMIDVPLSLLAVFVNHRCRMVTVPSALLKVSSFESAVMALAFSILTALVPAPAVVLSLKWKIAIKPFATGFWPPKRVQA